MLSDKVFCRGNAFPTSDYPPPFGRTPSEKGNREGEFGTATSESAQWKIAQRVPGTTRALRPRLACKL
ncbi:MAG: hypothetical protein Q4C96_09445 [Planctomycetia bacterium]|nr:hypothetical protein [Planctomycetia bacterium]